MENTKSIPVSLSDITLRPIKETDEPFLLNFMQALARTKWPWLIGVKNK